MIEFVPTTAYEKIKDITDQTLSELKGFKQEITDIDYQINNPDLLNAIENYDGSGFLDLSNKNITGDDILSAAPKISQLPSLANINLSNNKIEYFGTLQEPIFLGTKIQQINLSNNLLVEFSGHNIHPETAKNIEYLDINQQGDGWLDIIKDLDIFKKLKRISAEKNSISADSLFYQNRQSKNNFGSIESLFLKNNKINHLKWLNKFPNLEHLDLRNNDFFNLKVLEGSIQDLGKPIVSTANASFRGIKNSKIKKLYLDENIVKNLDFCMKRIDGGDEILKKIKDKKLEVTFEKNTFT